MSVELISVLIAMLAVGAALGGLILTSNRGSLPVVPVKERTDRK